ncbi:ATP--guanido phosphotransferase [Carboxydothermus islandicus]|uniref:Protein-arginine kinase n=1 Tax=Carboxydothermus islandicus TaxID=661089 RepID=A0A1L8CZL4_9THEO|nr:protein arginine kinase [Carboxydothermus islandicus]GAV24372.1 ATP--guanido phosphotransferase [Carboxydothermus islandicus]
MSLLTNSFSPWMAGTGTDADIVVSSRIRLARNLKDIPFPHLMDEETASYVTKEVEKAVTSRGFKQKFGKTEFFKLVTLAPIERQVLVEKHLISPDHADGHPRRAFACTEDERIALMINEEDHIRLQVLLPGLELREAYNIATMVDDKLEEKLFYAFSEKYGYLTACPTNTGTGIRASTMLHLPGLTYTNQIPSLLNNTAKLGLTVRGLYGEGTKARGDLYQVSNQITLGLTEEEIIENVISVTRQIINQERMAREALYRENRYALEDELWRSYGILTSARMISSEEAMNLLSKVRLGVELKILPEIKRSVFNELLVATAPAYLTNLAQRPLDPAERDWERAKIIREKLKTN